MEEPTRQQQDFAERQALKWNTVSVSPVQEDGSVFVIGLDGGGVPNTRWVVEADGTHAATRCPR